MSLVAHFAVAVDIHCRVTDLDLVFVWTHRNICWRGKNDLRGEFGTEDLISLFLSLISVDQLFFFCSPMENKKGARKPIIFNTMPLTAHVTYCMGLVGGGVAGGGTANRSKLLCSNNPVSHKVPPRRGIVSL